MIYVFQTLHFVPLAHVLKFISRAPQQFLGGPLLLILLTFFRATLGTLVEGFIWPHIMTLAALQVQTQAHLDLGPLGHPRPFQIHLAHQAPPQTHLDAFDIFQLAHIHPRLLRHSFRIGHLNTSFWHSSLRHDLDFGYLFFGIR